MELILTVKLRTVGAGGLGGGGPRAAGRAFQEDEITRMEMGRAELRETPITDKNLFSNFSLRVNATQIFSLHTPPSLEIRKQILTDVEICGCFVPMVPPTLSPNKLKRQ